MKRLAVKVHLWLGLTLGLVWAIQGLTGAALVFHREIDRFANPERAGSAGPMTSVDALIASAERATGMVPRRLSIVDARPDIVMADYEALGGHERQLFLDAATARPLGERSYDPATPGGGATSRFLYHLHERLTAGETGETIVGISGLVLLTSVATGLWIGWPRVWRGVARVGSWRSRPQKLYGWHRLVGLTAGAALLLITPAGIYMIFSKPVRAGLAAVVPHQAPFKPVPLAPGVEADWIPADEALATARDGFPGAAFVRLSLPTASSPVYAVRLRQAGEVRAWSGTTSVTVDALVGRVLDVYDPQRAPLSNRIVDAAFPLHNGEIAGFAGRVLVMLAGLSLPTFYVTGVWLWWSKRRRRSPQPRLMPAE